MFRKFISAMLISAGILLLYKRHAIIGGMILTEQLSATYGIVMIAIISMGLGVGVWPKKKRTEEEKGRKKAGLGLALVLLSLASVIFSLIYLVVTGALDKI